MLLNTLDWSIVIAFFAISLLIGYWVHRKSTGSSSDFFLSGRNMPWWLLGISMVATTFGADTPNLVTDLVRQGGVFSNWCWWAFLLTGMLTVFVYSKLWRRSNLSTDLEFYELRYSGKPASFLRGFRAIYLGLFFNCVVMANVTLAAVKIAGILLGLDFWETVLIAGTTTLIYSSLGGLKGVILTDFVQFILAMIGAAGAAWVIVDLPEINNLEGLLNHPNVVPKTDLIPSTDDWPTFVSILLIPLAVQWWASWYPGAEPGGGGYIAQRMLAAKDERHAVGATLLFNVAHYALRPWPWIIVGLASLIVYPDLASLATAFPHFDSHQLNHDMAYPAMLTHLPSGLLGIVVTSLIAAYMSTISTHLNWGASYMVYDWYKRFVKPKATEKEMVNAGRISTIILMICATLLTMVIESASAGFNLILQIGAGTGLIYILRWFWWRINAFSEITAMAISFVVAVFFFINNSLGESKLFRLESHEEMLIGVAITTLSWLSVTFLTKPEDKGTLLSFYQQVKPSRIGWKPFITKQSIPFSTIGSLKFGLIGMLLGCILVYCILFSTGYFLYGQSSTGILLLAIGISAGLGIKFIWKNLFEDARQ